MAEMRRMVAPMKGSVTGPSAREMFDDLMEKTPAADGVTYEKADVGGVPGWWCRPKYAAAAAAILYFHGGAYVAGSARAFQHFVGQVAASAMVAAFVPEYGLAPEHPFPVAVDEAQAAYRGLVEQGITKIALAGDSAGGGLALVLLSLVVAKARDGSTPCPIGAAVMSPWTDLALSGSSMEARAEADPLLTKNSLASTAHLYLGSHDARDPCASPLNGDLAGLPPVRIHVGEDEILLEDSLRYGERLEREGGTIQVHTWQGMIHVFPSNIAVLHSANEALDDIGDFLRQQFSMSGGRRLISLANVDRRMKETTPPKTIPDFTSNTAIIDGVRLHYFLGGNSSGTPVRLRPWRRIVRPFPPARCFLSADTSSPKNARRQCWNKSIG
jgi:acetyl esterase/lipase